MPTPPSPCVRNCCLNDADVCLGCRRTLQEILDWHRMSDEEKQKLLTELPQRQLGPQQTQPVTQETRRCFIGIELSDEIKRLLKQHSEPLRSQPHSTQFRWIPTQNYHITLAFMGALQEDRLEELKHALQRECWFDEPTPVDIQVIGGFPKPAKSRYLVAHVASTRVLSDIYNRLQACLKQLELPTEERSLRPHVTLARLKRGMRPVAVEDLRIPAMGFAAGQLTLFESKLSSEGSSYQPLARFR